MKGRKRGTRPLFPRDKSEKKSCRLQGEEICGHSNIVRARKRKASISQSRENVCSREKRKASCAREHIREQFQKRLVRGSSTSETREKSRNREGIRPFHENGPQREKEFIKENTKSREYLGERREKINYHSLKKKRTLGEGRSIYYPRKRMKRLEGESALSSESHP